MMDIEKLIERLNECAQSYTVHDDFDLIDTLKDSAIAFSMYQIENQALRNSVNELQAENEKLRSELEKVKQLYESEKEDFIDFACSGMPNISPYCMNRHPDCVDERGWCRTEKCRGFSRERDSQKED